MDPIFCHFCIIIVCDDQYASSGSFFCLLFRAATAGLECYSLFFVLKAQSVATLSMASHFFLVRGASVQGRNKDVNHMPKFWKTEQKAEKKLIKK